MNSDFPTSESELVTEPQAIGVSSNISSSVVIVHRNANTSDGDSLLQMEADTSEDFFQGKLPYLLLRFFKEMLTYVMRFFKEKLTYTKKRL